MRNNKKIVLVIALLVALACAVAAFTYVRKAHTVSSHDAASRHLPNVDYTPASPNDNEENEERKSQPPSSKQPNDTTPISITITRAGVRGDNLEVASLVQGAQSGTCTLTVSQVGQNPITSSESMQLQNNTYICPVFNLPLSSFPNKRAWNVHVTVNSNGSSAASDWKANPVQLSQ